MFKPLQLGRYTYRTSASTSRLQSIKNIKKYLVDFRLKNSSSHQRLNRRSTSRRSSHVTDGGLEGSASLEGWLPLMNTSASPHTQPQEHITHQPRPAKLKWRFPSPPTSDITRPLRHLRPPHRLDTSPNQPTDLKAVRCFLSFI
jgi:hypothetical protein